MFSKGYPAFEEVWNELSYALKNSGLNPVWKESKLTEIEVLIQHFFLERSKILNRNR